MLRQRLQRIGEKIIDLVDTVRPVQFSDNGIMQLLHGLVGSGNCIMIKYLFGRHRISHHLTSADACAIIERYANGHAYSDEAFLSLLIFLINGYAKVESGKRRLQELVGRLLQRGIGIATTPAYAKLLHIAEKCDLGALGMIKAMSSYADAPDDGEFSPSEDIFCAVVGAQCTRNVFSQLIRQAKYGKATHIARYVPFSWARRKAKVYIDFIDQAAKQGNFAVVEEMITALINTRQSPRNMCCFFEKLLKSDCRECIGIAFRNSTCHKLRRLQRNGITDWLLSKLMKYELHWCIPYLKGYFKDKQRYAEVVSQHSRKIINAAVTGEFRFSPLFHEMVRYDARNIFFIENLCMYLEALLDASTDRNTLQQLIIEICSAQIFDRIVNDSSMTAIYKLFRAHRDRFFYLNVFYYALRQVPRQNFLKALIMKDLKRSMAAGGLAAILRADTAALRPIVDFIQHSRYKEADTSQEYYRLIREVAFGKFLAMLRHAQIN